MADRKNVLGHLYDCLAASRLENTWVFVRKNIVGDAIAMLKEQEAVEPVLMREGRNEYYNDYVCPECDNELVFGQNFCSDCGRPVKWDG